MLARMTYRRALRPVVMCLLSLLLSATSASVYAQTQPPSDAKTPPAQTDDGTFKLGEIVYVLGKDPGSPPSSATVSIRR